MSLSYLNTTFPVYPNTGINWKHFEVLRKLVWLSWLGLDAGVDLNYLTINNPDAVSDTGWEGFAGGIGSRPGPEYGVWAGELNELVYICTVGGETIADVYGNHVEMSKATLIVNPPVFANGNFNSGKWRRVASFNYYHDWDKNSGRYFVRTNINGMGEDKERYLTDIPAYAFLPRQVDPKWQINRVKYTDTERRVCKRKYVEIDRSYITQPGTMGPKYSFSWYYDEVSHGWFCRKFSDYSSGVSFPAWGGQYTHDHPEPFRSGGTGYNINTKLCDAYQSAVEHVLSFGSWLVKVDNTTAWGQAYITNYTALYNTPNWDGETNYWAGEKARYAGKIWICIKNYNQGIAPEEEDPIYDGYWRPYLITDGDDGLPKYAYADDELWGCNCSAFELVLWIYGKYDWYFQPNHKYIPIAFGTGVMYRKAYALSEYHTQEEVDAAYPTGAGTWRRCFRHTFGRLGTVMMPGEKTPTNQNYASFQDYEAFDPPPAIEPCHWPGIYRHTDAGYTLTGEDAELITRRHDPSITIDSNEYYEIVAEILNDMYALLTQLKYADAGISILMEKKTAYSGNDPYPTGGTLRGAYTAAYEQAEEALSTVEWFSGIGGNTWHHASGSDYTYWKPIEQEWQASATIMKLRFHIYGGYRKGVYVSSLSILCGIRNAVWFTHDEPFWPYAVRVPTTVDAGIFNEEIRTTTLILAASQSSYSGIAFPYAPLQINIPTPSFDASHEYIHELTYAFNLNDVPAIGNPGGNGMGHICFSGYMKLCGPTIIVGIISFDMSEERIARVFGRNSIRDWNFAEIPTDDGLFNEDGFLI